jgi:hypothetical protein
MFLKGRPPQEVNGIKLSYKKEVLKVYPNAKWIFIQQGDFKYGAIWANDKRISEPAKVAFKGWESAYYTHKNNSLSDLFKY